MHASYDEKEELRHNLLDGFVAQARSACQRVADLTNGLNGTMLEPRLASSDFIGRGDACQVSFVLAEERTGAAAGDLSMPLLRDRVKEAKRFQKT